MSMANFCTDIKLMFYLINVKEDPISYHNHLLSIIVFMSQIWPSYSHRNTDIIVGWLVVVVVNILES